jgi:hypothetical protein
MLFANDASVGSTRLSRVLVFRLTYCMQNHLLTNITWEEHVPHSKLHLRFNFKYKPALNTIAWSLSAQNS